MSGYSFLKFSSIADIFSFMSDIRASDSLIIAMQRACFP